VAEPTPDYVIVGSGAGGGTLAARLAEAGKRVLLLEAGDDPCAAGSAGLPEEYDVPAFHAFASENPAMSWNFFVHHYGDGARGRRDPKWSSQSQGILYPRASGLGGCTAHNAMIFVNPHDADWNGIAALTKDPSWRASRMRRYVRRLEDCRHRPVWRWLRWLGVNPTGHGWRGWLRTERALPAAVFADEPLVRVLLHSALEELGDESRPLEGLKRLFERHADPNDVRAIRQSAEGLCYTPMTTREHRRVGTRERVLEVARRYPERLRIELNALATRVLLDESNRVVGVEYLKGRRLYSAHASRAEEPGEARFVRVSGEVVLAGGAFNSPQLLMLSGIGERSELERHGIRVRAELPGVGRNLQDRYEVGVVSRMAAPWNALKGARFDKSDAHYQEWLHRRDGMYVSNGAALAVIRRSAPQRSRAPPDLFCMAVVSRFEGYFPGYSAMVRDHPDYLTWVVLKAHTNNRAGRVTLRSAEPRDAPIINFNYFEGDGADDDLRAVVEGIRRVRRVSADLHRKGLIVEETLPGARLQTDEELAEFVRDNAWGHHASCSCAIGPREAGGVLNSQFEVYGTKGLRVVDASVFPRIPGFFVASAVYLVAEKAADVILAAARRR
jgi:choline dehydrogenase-like flavoprotein